MSELTHRRLLIVAVLVGALVMVLALRLLQIVVLRGPDLAAAAEQNRIRVVPQPAPRGSVLDSSGRILVGNTAAAGVLIDREVLAGLPDGGSGVLRRVADALNLSERRLRDRLVPCAEPGAPPRPVCNDSGPLTPVSVLGAGDEAALLTIAERPERYPGITLTSAVLRSYPGPGQGGNLLGVLGEPTAEDLTADSAIRAGDLLGRGGLEQTYDAYLRGRSGERHVLVDARGHVRAVVQDSAAIAGDDLVTSIDAELQHRSEAELADAVARTGSSAARGAAIVLDVRTGRVLAMASAPDFDPAEWVGGVSHDRYAELLASGALLDYPVAALVPPGSAYKPFSVVGMARAGLALHDTYECPGEYIAGGREFANHESVAYGAISLRRALALSCNTVFYRAADRLWLRGGGDRVDSRELGPIARAGLGFGLGATTGVDLPGETAGRIASPAARTAMWQDQRDAWCAAAAAGYPKLRRTDPVKATYFTSLDRENCRSGNVWRQGDAINAAIGQGLTAVTPIGMAVAYAAIANGGTIRRPTVGRAVVDPSGRVVHEITPDVVGRTGTPQRVLEFLRAALSDVPRTGTAAPAFAGFPLDRFGIAGKTGSAQVDGENSTAWFASFAPAQRPRYAVVVMVTDAGAGGDVAAPAVRGIYEALFGVGEPALFPPSGPPRALPSGVWR